ncbi:MAG: apolipoprotein N-acyltransferase [Thermoguttaceae bacterium]
MSKQHAKKEEKTGKFFDRTLFWALLAVTLHFLAIPPQSLSFLVVFAPVIWVSFVCGNEFSKSKYRYRKIYLSSLLFWLTVTYWVSFPHPLTILGWVALSAYMAAYLPIFIVVSRTILQRLPFLSALYVIPFVWCAVEWLRNHIFGGLSIASLEHAFYNYPVLIQISDLGGGYTVGMLIVFVGYCLYMILQGFQVQSSQAENSAAQKLNPEIVNEPKSGLQQRNQRFNDYARYMILMICVIAATLAYGLYRISYVNQLATDINVAVTQGTLPVMLNPPDDWWEKTYIQYIDLSRAAIKKAKQDGIKLDLIVWPESIFPFQISDFEENFALNRSPDENATPEEFRKFLDSSKNELTSLGKHLGIPLLVGAPVLCSNNSGASSDNKNADNELLRMNSVVYVDPKKGVSSDRYDKIHLVMFGEYVPLAEYLPDNFPLKTLCQTAARGKYFVSFPVSGNGVNDQNQNPAEKHVIKIAPNICFESLVPHLIRRQVVTLRAESNEPDILVNVSNVGWFYFSSEVDMQFAAQVFRAVENRKPYITAANSGISAVIDGNGKILAAGKKGDAEFLISEIKPDGRTSMYSIYGDWLSGGCLCLVCIWLFMALVKGFTMRDPS